MAKPVTVITWNTGAANRVTPSAGEQIAGYAINAVPTNIIIDRAGRVRYAKAAAFDLDDLNANLIPLLNEPAPIAN